MLGLFCALTLAASSQEDALYRAFVAHQQVLESSATAEEVGVARGGLRRIGREFPLRFPRSAHLTEVCLGAARATLDDDEKRLALELARDCALANDRSPLAVQAAQLALEAARQLDDFRAVRELALSYLRSNLPEVYRAEVRKLLVNLKQGGPAFIDPPPPLDASLQTAAEQRGTPRGRDALYRAFSTVRSELDAQRVRALGERFLREYPGSVLERDVRLTLLESALEARRWAAALQLAAVLPPVHRAAFERARGADAAARAILEAAPPEPDVLAALAELQPPAEAKATAERALASDPANARAAAVLVQLSATDFAGRERLELAVHNDLRAPAAERARTLYLMGELLLRDARRRPFVSLDELVKRYEQARRLYLEAGWTDSWAWASLASWKVAVSLQAFAADAKAHGMGDDAWRASLAAEVARLFDACNDTAAFAKTFDLGTLGCRARSSEVSYPVQVAEAPAAALDEARDDLEAQGFELLAASRLRDARTVFFRALEREGGRSRLHVAYGYTLLLTGDATKAAQHYQRALDLEPSSRAARANLAALRCRFLDVAGARWELEQLHGDPQGPEVDPLWRRCRD